MNTVAGSNGQATESQQIAVAPTIQMELQAPPESGISITYPGKPSVRTLLGKLRPRVQRYLSQYSYGSPEEQTQNLVVEGDNLQVMASLYRYRGQVDLILADPPYNTGNDFRYNDRWIEDPNDPNPGELVSDQDGSKHTKWMQFMAPRLEMMKAMLKPGGVCAVCIDDRELFRLGMMMDEIFGERNRIAIINWQKAYSPKSHDDHVSTATEYVLVYSRHKDYAKTGLLDRTESTDAKYGNPDDDPNGDWRPDNATAMGASTHPGQVYGIQNPFTGEIQYPPEGRCWSAERARMKRWLEEWGSPYVNKDLDDGKPSKALVLKEYQHGGQLNDMILASAKEKAEAIYDRGQWPELYFGKQGQGRPNRKTYREKVKKGKVPLTYWADEDYDTPLEIGSQSWDHEESGHSQAGKNELKAIVGPNHNFETVKPLKLITKIMQLWCPPNGIVLDPFAGSGTTGHAALILNEETGSNRRFILIEQSRPERGDAYARTLLADRLKRVLSGDWHSGKQPPLSGGFTFKTSTTQVDSKAVLAMQREELVDLVLMSHWEVRSRKGPMLTTLVHKDFKYLVAKDGAQRGYFLVWDGPDVKTPLTTAILREIEKEAESQKLQPPYHVYARTAHVLDEDVEFWKIPQDILAKIGFNDAFGVVEDR